RFEQEVAATTQLTHPNTVRVFDYGVTEDGIWYYAMELLDGMTLKELVLEARHLDVQRALRIAHHVARALAEAHLHGIVHRDIKPENIFITRAGNESDFVKVLDFGIAKFKEFEGADSLTKPGAIFGTPAYMSPEAARGKVVGPASDVYGVGAVLYFMLTGSPPFSGRNPTEVLLAHVERCAPNVTETAGITVDTKVEHLVQRCLNKLPEQRYSDATELAEALAVLRRALQ
ncbi:MAG TPA: serine/threonine-protein kinase, partial [Polyangiaceae bacterium]